MTKRSLPIAFLTLAILFGGVTPISYAQPVPFWFRPPTGCATGQGITWGGSSWVCGGGIAGFDPGIYGAGADGNLVYDGSSTVLGVAPSANVYILDRTTAPMNMTVNNGVTVKTANFRIIGRGTLANNGTVSNNGNDAGTPAKQNGGAGIGNTDLCGNLTGGAGQNGANGGNATANANILAGYWTASSAVLAAGAAGDVPGRGGAGGAAACAGSLFSAGQPGVMSVLSPTSSGATSVGLLRGHTEKLTCFVPSSGGGGGTGNGQPSGGGGSPGGILSIAFPVIAGSGSFQAKGGNGAAQTSGACASGGGGGGGGWIILGYNHATGSWATNVAGGTGGIGWNAGMTGGAGAGGRVDRLNFTGDGT